MPAHRLFAALYDRILAGSEKAGLGDMRAELIFEARGRTLEVGAGTGLNLPYYRDSVTELVLSEPDPFMARKLRAKLAARPPAPDSVRLVDAPAESLPFDSGSFDTVVGTLVLCTVGDPAAAAREIARVLAPGGRLLYLEHVRDPGEGQLARWQDRLERPWGWVGAGCHPNRDTARALTAAGFEFEPERGEFPKGPVWVRPLIRGSASLSPQ